MIIGFSTGCAYHHIDPASQEIVNIIRYLGCNAIEVHLSTIERLQRASGTLDLHGFTYKSIHAPKIVGSDEQSRLALDLIKELHEKHQFDAVTIHPDTIEDFSIFSDYDLPFAFENMNDLKK